MSGPRFSPDRFYLALDTSGPSGYLAVARGRDVLARTLLERSGKQASLILPGVEEVLEEGGVEVAELAGLVVGEGPGSFTGVRVTAATAKGMAFALGVPLWGLSSLAAAAVADLGQGGPGVRFVLFDARADRVYGACYGVGSRGVETLLPPHASDLRTVLAGEIPVGAAFAGAGAQVHRGVIEDAGFRVLPPPLGEPTADALLHLLSLHPDTPPVASLEGWEPRYVKASSAEREWTA